MPESEVTWSGSGSVFSPAAPFGLERGWTEVTEGSTGPARGELKPEEAAAAGGAAVAEVELEAAAGGFWLLVVVAGLSLRLSSAQSGQARWWRFCIGVFLLLSWNAR